MKMQTEFSNYKNKVFETLYMQIQCIYWLSILPVKDLNIPGYDWLRIDQVLISANYYYIA